MEAGSGYRGSQQGVKCACGAKNGPYAGFGLSMRSECSPATRPKKSAGDRIGTPSKEPSESKCFLSPETTKSAFPIFASAKKILSSGSIDAVIPWTIGTLIFSTAAEYHSNCCNRHSVGRYFLNLSNDNFSFSSRIAASHEIITAFLAAHRRAFDGVQVFEMNALTKTLVSRTTRIVILR